MCRALVSLAQRLRDLAEHLPPGGSVTITREGLFELATVSGGDADPAAAPAEFTIGELATRLHRSASTIRDWCEHGRFEGAYKLNGRDWRISRAALEAFLTEQRRRPPETVPRLRAWRAVRRVK